MDERAARSLGHANAPARTNLEIDGLARSFAERKPAKHRLAANAHIDELDGLRDIVQEGVSHRRTKARLGRSQSCGLRKLVPAQVDARKRARRDVFLRARATRESRSRIVDGVFLDIIGVIGRGETRAVRCEGRRVANHAITAIFHERHEIAGGLNLRNLEACENIDRFFAEFTSGGNFVGHGEAVVARRLVGETAYNACDGVNGASANERAQLIAQRLNAHSAIEKLGRRFRKGESAIEPFEIGGGKNEQVRCMILQEAAIHEQLAQNARALARLHAKNLFNRKQIGYHMARRANSANARGDIARLGEGASSHHRFE